MFLHHDVSRQRLRHNKLDVPFDTKLRLREIQQILHCDEVHERITNVAAYTNESPHIAANVVIS